MRRSEGRRKSTATGSGGPTSSHPSRRRHTASPTRGLPGQTQSPPASRVGPPSKPRALRPQAAPRALQSSAHPPDHEASNPRWDAGTLPHLRAEAEPPGPTGSEAPRTQRRVPGNLLGLRPDQLPPCPDPREVARERGAEGPCGGSGAAWWTRARTARLGPSSASHRGCLLGPGPGALASRRVFLLPLAAAGHPRRAGQGPSRCRPGTSPHTPPDSSHPIREVVRAARPPWDSAGDYGQPLRGASPSLG